MAVSNEDKNIFSNWSPKGLRRYSNGSYKLSLHKFKCAGRLQGCYRVSVGVLKSQLVALLFGDR